MRRLLIVALALLLIGCAGFKHSEVNKTIPTTPVGGTSMPYLKQAVVMKIDGNYKVVVFFELPNPCHKIEFRGMKIEGNTITIDFSYTPPKPGTVCIQVLKKYNKTIDLGRLAKGTYTILIRVNNVVVRELKFRVE